MSRYLSVSDVSLDPPRSIVQFVPLPSTPNTNVPKPQNNNNNKNKNKSLNKPSKAKPPKSNNKPRQLRPWRQNKIRRPHKSNESWSAKLISA